MKSSTARNQGMHVKLLKILMIFSLVSSCQQLTDVNWDPDFYDTDHTSQRIENADGVVIYCEEPKFDEFSCLSKNKIKELAIVLDNAKVPKHLEAMKNNLLAKLQRSYMD